MSTTEFNVREYLNNNGYNSYAGIGEGIIKFADKINIAKFKMNNLTNGKKNLIVSFNYTNKEQTASIDPGYAMMIIYYSSLYDSYVFNLHGSTTLSEGMFVSLPSNSYYKSFSVGSELISTLELFNENDELIVKATGINISGNSRTISIDLSKSRFKVSNLDYQ